MHPLWVSIFNCLNTTFCSAIWFFSGLGERAGYQWRSWKKTLATGFELVTQQASCKFCFSGLGNPYFLFHIYFFLKNKWDPGPFYEILVGVGVESSLPPSSSVPVPIPQIVSGYAAFNCNITESLYGKAE